MVPPHRHPPDSDRRLFSPASADEHARVGKRLLWALPVALVLLGLLTLLGPSADEIERKFTPYGAEGPLRIMPEIAVEDGVDPTRLEAKREVAPPPPAPTYQVEPEPLTDQADELVPEPSEEAAEVTDTGVDSETPVDEVQPNESDGNAAVELVMPSQFANSDFIIKRLVRPLYPPLASEADRMKPVITVEVAIFVNEEAEIMGSYVSSNDGGQAFGDAALAAVRQWELEPRLRNGVPPRPRWLVVPWRFRSPFTGLGQ
jgi:TonB family protein